MKIRKHACAEAVQIDSHWRGIGGPAATLFGVRKAKDLIRTLLFILLPIGVVSMAPLALHAQTLSFASAQSTVASGLEGPLGVAVDGAGDVFFAQNGGEDGAGNVVKVSPSGTTTTVASGLSFSNSYFVGVATDGAGDVFVVQTNGNPIVLKISPSGATTTVGSGLISPEGVAVDGKGDVFISDDGLGEVLEVPAGGGPQATLASGLFGSFRLAVDVKGDVFVVEVNSDGSGQILEVTASGSQTTVVSGLIAPRGVAVDIAGDLYIAEPARSSFSQVVEVPAGCTSASCQTTDEATATFMFE